MTVSSFLLLLSSCTPKIAPQEAPIPQPEAFTVSGTVPVPDEWWRSFEDPVLDSLVQQGLQENLSLAGSWQEYQASLAVVKREKSFLFPQIDAFAGVAKDRGRENFSEDLQLQTGLAASYELDLWGRVRAGVQAERYTAEAFLYDYRAAAMTISAGIANTWYQLLTARKQLELVEEQINTNEDIVKLIRARFAGGQIRAVDILRQEQLLESTRDQKILYETNLELLENRLLVLLGRPPQNATYFRNEMLPALPPLPQTGLPLELIRRRPDLQQAYNLVLSADREMAFAVRSKFPVISLDASGSFRAEDVGNIFENWTYSLAGNLLAPLIYGGRLSAEVDRAEAVKNQLLYEYGQAVLIAFEEVENALLREKKQRERLEVLERRLELSTKTSGQLRIEFLNGLSPYLDVLLALDEQQQLEREMLEGEQELLEIRIGLYRALAGAFENPQETDL
ncbi:efflux transporter outer membrane subunit [Salinimicrobium sp. 3283s]|uniref:efflux transporter outer membrane subunit n=1 Tax=Salinimicrobium sp. 3283s TaxID=3114359 RepID=UPI0031E6176E